MSSPNTTSERVPGKANDRSAGGSLDEPTTTRQTNGTPGIDPRSFRLRVLAEKPVPPAEVTGERLALRRCCKAYAPLLPVAVLESVETVGRWLPWCHADYQHAESVAWLDQCEADWDNNAAHEFAIFDNAGEYIGGAGLHDVDRAHNIASVGYRTMVADVATRSITRSVEDATSNLHPRRMRR